MDTFIKDSSELRPYLAQAFEDVGEMQYAQAARSGSNESIVSAGMLAMIAAYSRGREDMRKELQG